MLIFDGRADPINALAAASSAGGRFARSAPATAVIVAEGALAHLQEMAPASVDAILAWTADDETLTRAISRLLDTGYVARTQSVPSVAANTVPMTRASSEATPASTPLPSEQIEAALKTAAEPVTVAPRRFRILVADSNLTNRMVVERMLSRATHEVLLVGDGNAALTALEVGGIDAAVLDIKLPELSGYHVAKLYRQMEMGTQRLPLVGLAADATTETDRLCREAGMDAMLIKPVQAGDMLSLLDRLVQTPLPQRGAANSSGMVVTSITSHPRFTRETAPVIDREALGALAGLGDGFVQEVVDTFFIDAEQILQAMGNAQSDHDLSIFQDQLLAMRSSAVNLGGARLVQTLRDAGRIDADQLQPTGDVLIAKIRSELDVLRAELRAHLERRS